ncbi:MAG: hypothetical protein M3O15_09395 [Acidobacteriota bacterium]|nr:hypothetical protein [Acidobacteriota bacterium]
MKKIGLLLLFTLLASTPVLAASRHHAADTRSPVFEAILLWIDHHLPATRSLIERPDTVPTVPTVPIDKSHKPLGGSCTDPNGYCQGI